MRTSSPSIVGAIVCAALCSVPAVVGAQHASAEQHYAAGSRDYAQRRVAEAAREFESAYALSREPALLYNIGRAHEDGGATRAALEAYERFEATGAPDVDRAGLRARIERLRADLRSTPAVATVLAPPIVPRRAAAPPARPLPVGPIVLVASGAALALGAVPAWISARATYDELDAQCPRASCPASRAPDADRARTLAVVGDALLGVGVGVAAAGVAWWVLGRGASERAPRAAALCTPAGCGASVQLRF